MNSFTHKPEDPVPPGQCRNCGWMPDHHRAIDQACPFGLPSMGRFWADKKLDYVPYPEEYEHQD